MEQEQERKVSLSCETVVNLKIPDQVFILLKEEFCFLMVAGVIIIGLEKICDINRGRGAERKNTPLLQSPTMTNVMCAVSYVVRLARHFFKPCDSVGSTKWSNKVIWLMVLSTLILGFLELCSTNANEGLRWKWPIFKTQTNLTKPYTSLQSRVKSIQVKTFKIKNLW